MSKRIDMINGFPVIVDDEIDGHNSTTAISNLTNDYFTSYYQRISMEVDNKIKEFLIREVQTQVDDNRNTVDNITYKVNIKMIFAAIGKQRKKKPIVQHNNAMKYLGIETINCPTCFSIISKGVYPRYCPDCGQALDWSVMDNEKK